MSGRHRDPRVCHGKISDFNHRPGGLSSGARSTLFLFVEGNNISWDREGVDGVSEKRRSRFVANEDK